MLSLEKLMMPSETLLTDVLTKSPFEKSGLRKPSLLTTLEAMTKVKDIIRWTTTSILHHTKKSQSAKKQEEDDKQLGDSFTSYTDVSTELGPDCCVFGDELRGVQEDHRVTKITFRDFVERSETNDIRFLAEILDHTRPWRLVKFADKIDGSDYRRWLFKKGNVWRHIKNVVTKREIPVLFHTKLIINVDELMSPSHQNALSSLLSAVKKDQDVTSVVVKGCVDQAELRATVDGLVPLMLCDQRRWKSVVFRFAYKGNDSDHDIIYDKWMEELYLARDRLHRIAVERGIPVRMKLVQA
jgi:hypothetical protein